MVRSVLAVIIAQFIAAVGVASGAEFQVGVATVDVTPDYAVRLNGFGGRHAESTGVRQPLFAKALAVGTTDDDAVVVITVDTLGIPDAMTERIAARLRERVGLDRSRLAICASHTHSGPMIKDCANTLYGVPIPDDHWQRILKYTDQLEAALEQAAIDALAARQPATLSWGIGRVTFANNRRTSGGPVDHDLPVLAVHGLDGALRAVFTNYACHCVIYNDTLLNGDWVGSAMEHIQRLNPGCTALVSIGCGADSNPRGRGQVEADALSNQAGLEIAQEVQRLLESGLTPITAPPVSQFERVTLPLAPLPSRERWEELAKADGAVGHHARTQLARLDRGEAVMTEISYPIQSIAFGDELAWVFLPGEVVVDYALRLKRELDGGRLWINAYSNACPGYVPSERILTEGGYEGGGAMIYYDIPGPYATGLEETIVSAVHRQLDPSFRSVVDASKTDGIRPLSPAAAVRALRVTPGLRVELAAAEPLVQSPVAITFDPDGRRVWVAEMRDYPIAPADQSDQSDPTDVVGGAIRCLFDGDRDGRMDRSTVFLDGLPFPTGVTVWRNGVLICAAPDILYAEDTNGDDRADKVETLFTGFATHNFQARVNSLEYGLDGWVYGSCGLFGGTITSTKTGQVIELGGRDFRCKPDTGEFEPVTGCSQQGRVRNDAGDWFGCNNTTPLMHYPLDDAMLRRNPLLTMPETTVVVSDSSHALFPIASQVLFALSGPPGRPTAACGLGIYRDTLLGPEFHGDAFVCEPVNNLVTRLHLEPRGVTFHAKRDEHDPDREFLASADPWFRPVQVRTGPDGALWVVDMARYVIEHPIWIPPDRLAQLDPRAGSTLGRIYRVTRDDDATRTMPDLSVLNGVELADALDSPNGTQRDLVQQQLIWTDALSDESTARIANVHATSIHADAKLHALTILGDRWSQRLVVPDLEAMLLRSMRADPPAFRAACVKIAAAMQTDALLPEIERLAADESPIVRMQVAYAARALSVESAGRVLAALLDDDERDPLLFAAIESSYTQDTLQALFNELMHSQRAVLPRGVAAAVLSTGAIPAAVRCLSMSSELVERSQTAETIGQFRECLRGWRERPADLFKPASGDLTNTWTIAWRRIVAIAEDDAAEQSLRVEAIRTLKYGTYLRMTETGTLLRLLSPQTDPALQREAISSLAESGVPEVATALLTDWSSRSPDARATIVSHLLERHEWTTLLLKAVQAGEVSASDISLSSRQLLLSHGDDAMRQLAESALKQTASPDRAAVFAKYVDGLPSEGSVDAGRRVFTKHCATCHQLRDDAGVVGHEVGPDIGAYAMKPATSLLEALLNPGQAVDPRYQNYIVVLSDGRTVNGLVRNETSAGFELLAAEAKRTAVRRGDVDELRSTGKSLMPDGLEQTVSPQDVADLLAWLRTLQSPFKSLPGNQPVVVEIPSSGRTALLASQAEIRGGDITFELPFQNVGYWHGADDTVAWRLRADAPRKVDVWIEFACDPGSAGDRLLVDGFSDVLTATVPSTGSWSHYQLLHLGTRVVRGGESSIRISADTDPHAALIDLRAVHLVEPDTVPLAAGSVAATDIEPPDDPQALAAFLLNDDVATEQREAAITRHLTNAADIIPYMVTMLPSPSGSDEEYRRIPWIWRVAIAVGRSDDGQLIRSVLERSLPADDQPLTHWQSVVIGGGLTNGLSLDGKWPAEALTTLIGEDRLLLKSWQRTLTLAAAMADDEAVPTGTRYDALRIIALLPWRDCKEQLSRYVKPGTHDELQMGAISGLSDCRDPEAATLLLSGLNHYSSDNRRLAVAALLRTDERCLVLLKAVQNGSVARDVLSADDVRALRQSKNAEVASLTSQVFGTP